ncbi:MAG: hypothetical protein PVI33_06720 [Candidatus Omnitrophota bacterium]|jgi:hypothetical protein
MKRLIGIVIVLSLILSACPAFAAKGGEKGASARAYERASEQAVFHRISDWFATIGKSKEEKAKILQERKAKRAAKQAEKEARKAKEQAEQTAEEAAEKAEKAKEEAWKIEGEEPLPPQVKEDVSEWKKAREKEMEEMEEKWGLGTDKGPGKGRGRAEE